MPFLRSSHHSRLLAAGFHVSPSSTRDGYLLESCFWSCRTRAAVCCCCWVCCKPCLGNCNCNKGKGESATVLHKAQAAPWVAQATVTSLKRKDSCPEWINLFVSTGYTTNTQCQETVHSRRPLFVESWSSHYRGSLFIQRPLSPHLSPAGGIAWQPESLLLANASSLVWRSDQCPLTPWTEWNLLGGTCAGITSFGS